MGDARNSVASACGPLGRREGARQTAMEPQRHRQDGDCGNRAKPWGSAPWPAGAERGTPFPPAGVKRELMSTSCILELGGTRSRYGDGAHGGTGGEAREEDANPMMKAFMEQLFGVLQEDLATLRQELATTVKELKGEVGQASGHSGTHM
ncbi:hypothetical protein NDU88_011201 [Pleurodeles waltl]|uniref:Heat shock factor-binding protein 1-like protein 1 n=1 Tax=Pleurodeles waltl TaxID=8319 RepID=A0AAV7QZD9_PLEWA|nr:hypothetical protein NDU88_011201 [Pleurodeles waltl]